MLRRFSRRTWILVLLAALLVVALASVMLARGAQSPSGKRSNAHDRGVILFVGDSNITLGSEAIDWALTWGDHSDDSYTPVFASRVGAAVRTPDCVKPSGCRRHDYWKIKLGDILPKIHPDTIVTNLGINSAKHEGTPTTQGYAGFGQKIDWFMRLLPAQTPVIWTNLPCAIEPAAWRAGCRRINAALAHAHGRWRNLSVPRWDRVANDHPEYMTPGEVHYTPAGRAAWAEFIKRRLDARLPAA